MVDAIRGYVDERGGLEYQRWPLAGTRVAPVRTGEEQMLHEALSSMVQAVKAMEDARDGSPGGFVAAWEWLKTTTGLVEHLVADGE